MPIGFAGWMAVANTATNAYTAKSSADAAEEQMRFQGQQSDTAVQRRVADLRAAGINPILGAGQSAQAMSGAQPSTFTQPGMGASAFMEARLNREHVKLLKEQQMNTFRDTEKKQWEARAAESFSLKADQERRTEEALTQSAKFAVDVARRDATMAYEDDKFYRTPEGRTMRNVQRIGESFAPGASALQNLFRFRGR